MRQRSIGLGDTVKKVIEFLGLHKLMPLDTCGCERRRQKLNAMFPYRREQLRQLEIKAEEYRRKWIRAIADMRKARNERSHE